MSTKEWIEFGLMLVVVAAGVVYLVWADRTGN